MKQNKYTVFTSRFIAIGITTIVAFFSLHTVPVFAQTEDFSTPAIEQTGLARGSLTATIARVINIFLGFLGLIALILIIYAGIIWMTSGGNQDKISQAKKIMINGVIGLAIILGAAVIANFIFWLIGRATGHDLGSDTGSPPVTCIGDGCFLAPPGNTFKLTSHSPADNEVNVKACRAVQGVFNSTVDEVSLATAFSLVQEGVETSFTAVSGGALSVNENAFRFYLAEGAERKDFLLNTSYTAKVSTDARASVDATTLAGLRMSSSRQWRFTTSAAEEADDLLPQVDHTEGPRIFDVSPRPGATNICLTPPIQAVFTEEMDITTLQQSYIVLIDTETGVSVPLKSVSIGSDLQSFTIQPLAPLQKPATGIHEYEMRLYTKNDAEKREGILDVCGNPLNGKQDDPIGNTAQDFVWRFSTGVQSTDECQPEITALSPATARYGQTVTISGARFGARGEVTFNTTIADSACSIATPPYLLTTPCVQRWGETEINIKVPLAATTGKITIGLGEDLKTVSKEQIDILSPYLHDASPNPVRKKELLRLVGRNFGSMRGAVEFIKEGAVVKTITNAPDVCKSTSETWNDHSLTIYIPDDLAIGEYTIRVNTLGSVSEVSNRIPVVVENGAPRPGFCSITPFEGPVNIPVVTEGIHLNRISHIGLASDIRVNRADFSSASDTEIGFTIPSGTHTGYVAPFVGDDKGTPAWFRVLSGFPRGTGPGGPGTGPGTSNPNNPPPLPKNPRLMQVHPTGPSPTNCSIVLEFDRPMNVESVASHTRIDFEGSALSHTSAQAASGKKVLFFPQTENKQWPLGSGSVAVESSSEVQDAQGNALDCANSPVTDCQSSLQFIPKTDTLKRLNVSPSSVTMQIGGVGTNVSAVPIGEVCEQGITVVPVWESSDSSIARIGATADSLNVRVDPVALGETQVIASAEGKRGFSIIKVLLRSGPPFYVVQAGPQGVNRHSDEMVTVSFNASVDSSTATPDAIQLTKQGDAANLSRNPDGSSAIEFIDPSKIRIRRLANKGSATESPIDFDLNASYNVALNTSALKTTTAPTAVLDCSRAKGLNAEACSYQFSVTRGPAPVVGIVFNKSEYSLKVGAREDATITVFAQDSGEPAYPSSRRADFVMVHGIEYVVSNPNPHPPSQRFQIQALKAFPDLTDSEAMMRTFIGDIDATAPIDAVLSTKGSGCTGDECSDIPDPARQIRIVSITADGARAGTTCRATLTVTLDKYVSPSAFPVANLKVFEQVGGSDVSRMIALSSATSGVTKVLQFVIGDVEQKPSENTELRLQMQSPLPHVISIDQTSAQLVIDISRRFGEGKTSPLCSGGVGCPREDVNRDGNIDTADMGDVIISATSVEYGLLCNEGACEVSYSYGSIKACEHEGSEDSGPPTIVDIAPLDQATQVCTNSLIQVVFDRGIASTSVVDSLIAMNPSVPGRKITIDGRLLQIRPASGQLFSPSTVYEIGLLSGSWGRNGESLKCGSVLSNDAGACVWSFTTAATVCRVATIQVAPAEVAGMTVADTAEVHIHEGTQALFVGVPFSASNQPLSSPPIAKWTIASQGARISEQNGQHSVVVASRTTRAIPNKIIAELSEPETKTKIIGEYPFTIESCKQHFVVKDTDESYNEINTNYLLTDDGPSERVRSPHSGIKTHFATFACIDDLEEEAWPVRVSIKTEIPDRPRFTNIHYIQVPNPEQPEEPDAIIILTGKNDDRLSLDDWVREASLPIADGQGKITEQTNVGGYPAARAGTSVYVRSADYDGTSNAFTTVTVLSYNEGAQPRTVQLFNALVNSMTFNTNLSSESTRERFRRDALRVMDVTYIVRAIESNASGHPPVPAGSFEQNHTTSRWNSWQTELGRQVGVAFPVDPLNLFDCPLGYDQSTCWNKAQLIGLRFVCKPESYVYQYRYVDQDRFDIKAHFEFERVTWVGVDDAPMMTIPSGPATSGSEQENQCVNVVISP
ncbi:MAG: hypothetical protein UV70_C0002G0068 [Parcubacteria group bacterium GW2011_GWA2_43_13]|nr:MAG: hypothetical protein UV70_C0002G0068 [Parcubacteria group bacterium GW2011_GWA2_43_13]